MSLTRSLIKNIPNLTVPFLLKRRAFILRSRRQNCGFSFHFSKTAFLEFSSLVWAFFWFNLSLKNHSNYPLCREAESAVDTSYSAHIPWLLGEVFCEMKILFVNSRMFSFSKKFQRIFVKFQRHWSQVTRKYERSLASKNQARCANWNPDVLFHTLTGRKACYH